MNSEQQHLWIVSLVAIVAIVAMTIFVGRGPAQIEQDSWVSESNMGGMASFMSGNNCDEKTNEAGGQTITCDFGDHTCTRTCWNGCHTECKAKGFWALF